MRSTGGDMRLSSWVPADDHENCNKEERIQLESLNPERKAAGSEFRF